MEESLDFKQLRGFLRRRRKSFFITFFAIMILGFSIAVLLTPIYRSEATIIIEDQQIPVDYVEPTTNEYAEERIEKISQQVLSRPNLLKIIDKYNLYSEEKANLTPTEMLSMMRKDITLETINAEKKNKKGGSVSYITVAFRLYYEGKNPQTVQDVTNKLANLYLEEDVKSKKELGKVTTDFLNEELERLKKDILIQEQKVSDFKKENIGKLPEDRASNLQAIARLEREFDKKELQLKYLKEKKILLSARLENIEPLTPIIINGEDVAANPSARLKQLHLQLARTKSIYSEKHPDIKRLKKEISDLEKQVDVSDSSREKIKRLNQLQAKLTELSSTLGSQHPDVLQIRREIELVSTDLEKSVSQNARNKISKENPDNPAYINIKAQIDSINMETQAAEEDLKKISMSIEKYQNRNAAMPIVESKLKELTRNYQNLQKKYSETSNKLMGAKVSQQMEGKQKGRRFTITAPAYLPLKPTKPNRLLVLILTLVVGIGVSYCFIAIQESMDTTIKSPQQLKNITGVPVLSSIEFIETKKEKSLRKLKKIGLFILFISFFCTILIVVNRYFVKLDLLWQIFLERVKLII
jgi:uncharacterized protein involved in exopolysaccharide biosynthesis